MLLVLRRLCCAEFRESFDDDQLSSPGDISHAGVVVLEVHRRSNREAMVTADLAAAMRCVAIVAIGPGREGSAQPPVRTTPREQKAKAKQG